MNIDHAHRQAQREQVADHRPVRRIEAGEQVQVVEARASATGRPRSASACSHSISADAIAQAGRAQFRESDPCRTSARSRAAPAAAGRRCRTPSSAASRQALRSGSASRNTATARARPSGSRAGRRSAPGEISATMPIGASASGSSAQQARTAAGPAQRQPQRLPEQRADLVAATGAVELRHRRRHRHQHADRHHHRQPEQRRADGDRGQRRGAVVAGQDRVDEADQPGATGGPAPTGRPGARCGHFRAEARWGCRFGHGLSPMRSSRAGRDSSGSVRFDQGVRDAVRCCRTSMRRTQGWRAAHGLPSYRRPRHADERRRHARRRPPAAAAPLPELRRAAARRTLLRLRPADQGPGAAFLQHDRRLPRHGVQHRLAHAAHARPAVRQAGLPDRSNTSPAAACATSRPVRLFVFLSLFAFFVAQAASIDDERTPVNVKLDDSDGDIGSGHDGGRGRAPARRRRCRRLARKRKRRTSPARPGIRPASKPAPTRGSPAEAQPTRAEAAARGRRRSGAAAPPPTDDSISTVQRQVLGSGRPTR